MVAVLRVKIMLSALIMLVVVLAIAGCSNGSVTGQALAEGGTAPDFTLRSLDGKVASLADFRGRPVVLNFWATWCGPCRQEIPFLQEVSEDSEWKERGLMVLAVNLGESSAAVRAFVDSNRLTFTVLLDSTHEVGAQYNARYIPTTYFIDKDGIIRNIKIGAFTTKSDLDRSIINMLTNG
jgi:cytochrome c biogenesis protein CcmG/thiol:disulfide interchange protein DsbE